MTEREKVILVQVIAEEVQDLVKGKSTSSSTAILRRLRRYEEKYDTQPPRD